MFETFLIVYSSVFVLAGLGGLFLTNSRNDDYVLAYCAMMVLWPIALLIVLMFGLYRITRKY